MYSIQHINQEMFEFIVGFGPIQLGIAKIRIMRVFVKEKEKD